MLKTFQFCEDHKSREKIDNQQLDLKLSNYLLLKRGLVSNRTRTRATLREKEARGGKTDPAQPLLISPKTNFRKTEL